MQHHSPDSTLVERLAALEKSGGTGGISARDLIALVEELVGTLEGDLSPVGVKLYAEIEALAQYIEKARAEITALRPDEIRDHHLPTATDELEAVLGSTEEATNGILGAVEKIEALTAEMPPAVAEAVTGAVTQVYESCNFQDVTGQRINKVVKTLQHIERTVNGLLAAFGDEIAKRRHDDHEAGAPAAAAVSDSDLLNGPQLPQDAKRQAEIDALFGSAG
jgi:chemotaxis protein CheZ